MSAAEAFQFAQQEFRRADHSIAVSLKYTRTVDVIKAIVERMINCIGYGFDAMIMKAKAEKKISEVPELPRLKIEAVKKLYPEDTTIKEFTDFYGLLRRIDKAKFERMQEYRRHVTMRATLEDGECIDITIDIITDYYDRVKEFLQYVEKTIGEMHE